MTAPAKVAAVAGGAPGSDAIGVGLPTLRRTANPVGA